MLRHAEKSTSRLVALALALALARPVPLAFAVQPPAVQTAPAAPPVQVEAPKPADMPEPLVVTSRVGGDPAPGVTMLQPPPPASWQRPTGWALVGTGAAILVTGLALGIVAVDDRVNLLTNKLPDGVHYDGRRVTSDQVFAEQTAINRKVTAAVVLGSVGALASALGAWALLTSPAKVAVTPGPVLLGAGLAVRF